MITIEFIVIILCLLIGTRFGGMGLGLISGIGLFILSFVFGLQPGKPPVDVMLTILAVIGWAATLQTAGGLNVMMQLAITASPVSVAVVSLVSILGAQHGIGHAWGILEILAVSVPASLSGVAIAALWSLRRGKNLADDTEFQEKLKDPKQREFIYGGTETLMDQRFPKQAYWSTWIFFAGIAVVVLLGALPELRPAFEIKGKMTALSMNLVIQMMMLIAGAIMLMTCKVNASAISNGAVFKAGMVAIFSVFGVAWMSDTFFQAHLDELKMALEGVVKSHPWTYAIVLFLVSKLVNSQAAALTAVAPMGLMLGIDPKMLVAFFPASYGYFVLPTYPSDLACIGFDRSGTTRIGKFIINHSFILPGLIGVSCACVVSYLLVQTFF